MNYKPVVVMTPWHTFRHPGLCGLKGTICVFAVISVIILVPFLLTGHSVVDNELDNRTDQVKHNVTHSCAKCNVVASLNRLLTKVQTVALTNGSLGSLTIFGSHMFVSQHVHSLVITV